MADHIELTGASPSPAPHRPPPPAEHLAVDDVEIVELCDESEWESASEADADDEEDQEEEEDDEIDLNVDPRDFLLGPLGIDIPEDNFEEEPSPSISIPSSAGAARRRGSPGVGDLGERPLRTPDSEISYRVSPMVTPPNRIQLASPTSAGSACRRPSPRRTTPSRPRNQEWYNSVRRRLCVPPMEASDAPGPSNRPEEERSPTRRGFQFLLPDLYQEGPSTSAASAPQPPRRRPRSPVESEASEGATSKKPKEEEPKDKEPKKE
ncbi:hypothetical protein B9Z55_007559 [Caenorhabditis nigoni]|uniref:Uncharacterized protein n=1 Tax=Caenorhabditis nigoni TaxID=1611254 RepID=A0A2G5VA50_9PELO|nr:hypothetical protein B9Z55_007559 [Caenorhabditis nigoni]